MVRQSGMRAVAALGSAALLVGCAGQVSPEQSQALCDVVASSIRTSGYPATPSRQQAIDSGNELDEAIVMVASPAMHDLSVQLHSQIHSLELAQEQGDAGAVEAIDAQWKDSVNDALQQCDLQPEAVSAP